LVQPGEDAENGSFPRRENPDTEIDDCLCCNRVAFMIHLGGEGHCGCEYVADAEGKDRSKLNKLVCREWF